MIGEQRISAATTKVFAVLSANKGDNMGLETFVCLGELK